MAVGDVGSGTLRSSRDGTIARSTGSDLGCRLPRGIHVSRTMSIGRRLGPVLLIAALGVGVAGVAPVAAASTVVVAADGQASLTDCDALTSVPTSIQAAVDAAAPGTTIRVCPGSYKELVTVGSGKDGVSIVAVRSFSAKLRVPNGVTADGLLTIDGADAVTVRGLTLLGGSSKSCGTVEAGILLRDTQDSVIRGNRLAPTAENTLTVCSFGYGIAIDDGTDPKVAGSAPASALIGWNLVRDPRFGGILVAGAETSATVQRNSIRYWHTAMSPTRVVRHAPSGLNGVFGTVGIGVESGANAVITDNAVSSGPDADVSGGVRPVSTPVLLDGIAAKGAGTVRITGNLVRRVLRGIDVTDNALTRVTDNRVRTTRTGIVSSDADARFLRNTVRDSDLGINPRVGGQVFRDNVLTDNGRADCLDETTGGGTLGTGNTWSGNSGSVSYPVGICGSGAPDITVTFIGTPMSTPDLTPAGGGPLRTPTQVAGSFPGSPVPLSSNGIGGYEGTIVLPLDGTLYSYVYRDALGPVEVYRPARVLLVVNEGGLRMTVEDVLELAPETLGATR